LIVTTRYLILKLVKILSDLDVFGKRVFVRADLDVPLREAQVVDGERLTTSAELEISTRLTNLKPTIDYLLEHEVSQIIIAGHIDRPSPRLRSGKPVIDPALSTKQLLPVLEKILKSQIAFYPDVSTQPTPGVYQVDSSGSGLVVLLENLRFWPGEEANDLEFARQLASMADVYINDALSVSHREHASVVALPSLLPHAVGLHLQEEIEVLSELLKNPQRPFVAIVGGAKIETKVPVIENLAKVADWVIVGGALAKEIRNYNEKIKIAQLTEDTKDIDRESIEKFRSIIATAKTVVWNGPMGVFEERFDEGSMAVANAIIKSGAYSVVGGGETTEFLASKKLLEKFFFVSSGGGAMLGFLSGKELPGLVALE